MTFEAARIHFFGEVFAAVVIVPSIGTLRSDNSDVHENVAEKQTSHHFKRFRDYPITPCYLKEGHFGRS